MSERGAHPVGAETASAGEPAPVERAIPAPAQPVDHEWHAPAAQRADRDWHSGTVGPQAEPQPIDIGGEPFRLSGDPQDDEHSAAAPRSKVRTIVLGSLLVVALAGAGVIGYAGWRIATEKDATVTAPPQVADLSMDQSEDGRATADYLQTALSAEVDLDKAVGAVYTDASGHDVLFFGGSALIWTPESDLDTAFGLVSDDQGAVTDVHDVPPGKLGGTMKCGKTATKDGDMAVCGWADHGSLALAMFPNRSETDSAKLLVQIRDAAQERH